MVAPDDGDVPVPDGWCTATLDDTGLYVNGIAFKPSDWCNTGRPIIRIQNLSGLNGDYHFASGAFPEDNIARPGDLLVSWSATLDAFIWLGPESLVNQHIFKVIPNLEAVTPMFLYWLLKHEVRQLARSQHAHGLAMMHINRGPFLAHTILLPPHSEQQRIVTMIDQMMALCDQIEATHRERDARRDALRTASLQRLTAWDRDDAWIQEDVRFFLDLSQRLITKPEHVVEIRRSIMDLAVRGRLVQQEATDVPAAESLAASDLVRSKTASKDRRAKSEVQELLSAEHRWEIPATWEWRGLADLVLFIDYRGKTPTKTTEGIRLITAKNVRRAHLALDPVEFISEIEYGRWMTRGLPEVGDVLFTTEAPMGNAAVVRLTEKFALAQRVINFRPYGAIDPDFLVLQLTSDPFQEILDRTATGLTAKGIKAAKLKRLPTAIPPLAEQHRIVAKVDELMTVCDELEVALASAQTDRGRLLEALLHEALAGGTELAATASA
jgi:type I restriction enzyme S subunit